MGTATSLFLVLCFSKTTVLYSICSTHLQVAEVRRKWITTGIGLGVIPFIVHPIDSLVHGIMDNTTRKVIGGVPKPPDA